MTRTQKESPWLFRTYAGHSTAAQSNTLFRTNLSKGQTGLSVAFDLPTQTGYDSDDPRARGEVGKVGVPVADLADMRRLFDGIPLGTMNTSMTINATAMWLLALYQVVAEEQALTELRKTLSAEDFSARAAAFDAKVERIRTEQDAKARLLVERRDEERKEFLQLARPVLGELLGERQATAILDKGLVIASLSSIDITDEAIAKLDAALSKPPADP